MSSQTQPPHTCRFRTPEGHACVRRRLPANPYCSLHFGHDCKPTEEPPPNPHFAKEFEAVLHANDGNWRGFVFPAGVRLPTEIPFEVDARGSRLSSFEQEGVVFKEPVNFSDAIFHGGLALRRVVFEHVVTFDRCRFQGPVDLLNVHCDKNASFYRSDFANRTILRVNFRGPVNFNESIFREGVTFAGWRSVNVRATGIACATAFGTPAILPGARNRTIGESIRHRAVQAWRLMSLCINTALEIVSDTVEKIARQVRMIRRRYAKTDPDTEIYKMFEVEGHIEDVVFLRADKTLFSQVDLSKVHFRGTNLRGARFLGVTWRQPDSKRNGLYDETFLKLSNDGSFRHVSLPVLEETCRNARVALEENRSFNLASDFYIGEMEAVRAQLPFWSRHLFSVPALYGSVSRYGTNVWVAFRMFFLLYSLHLVSTIYIESLSGTVPDARQISDGALRSFKVLLFQTYAIYEPSVSAAQSWLDLVFRVLGPIQIAMLALAFRSRIKRH